MESLKRARRPVRREFEKLLGELEILLKQIPLNVDVINVKFKLFNDAFESLSSHDAGVVEQMTTDDVPTEEEDKEWDEIRELGFRGETLRQLKEKLLPSPSLPTTASVDGASNSVETRVRNFKLPSVQLKKFSGKLKDWLGFWAQFQKIHDDPQMTGSDKYWYLLQSLQPNTDAYEIANGYPASNENYDVVIEALQKQYGNEDLLLQVYIREILNLVISNGNSKEKLSVKSLFLKLDSHLRALRTLNLEKADPATWLFPLVESSLPEDILYNWQRNSLSSYDGTQDDPPKTRLDLLMSFVEREVEIRQRIDLTKSFANQQNREVIEKKFVPRERRPERRASVPTLSSFHVGEKRVCVFCDKTNHETVNCRRAKMMAHEEKIGILKDKRLCFRCMGNHMSIDCKASHLQCGICKKQHRTIICKEMKMEDGRRWSTGGGNRDRTLPDRVTGFKRPAERPFRDRSGPLPKRPATETENKTTSSSSNVECMSEVALQTLLVKVHCDGESNKVRAFIDSVSQRSYILKSTATRLGLETIGIERVVHSLFGGQQTSTKAHNKYEIRLSSVENDYSSSFEVRDSERICASLPRIANSHPDIVEELLKKDVVLTDLGVGKREVELLIGADIYAKIVTGKIEKLKCGAVAISTELGWTLLGNVAESREETNMANIYTTMLVHDVDITKLWQLEVIGVEDPSKEKTEMERLKLETEKFIENISRMDDGRYVVKMPWKNNLSFLPSNRPVAYKRLQSTSQKLKDKGLFAAYNSIFLEWEKEGFIERVSLDCSADVIHYLPHRPIVKESSTTPVRPVFDASCRVGKSPSLNDCLFTGESYVRAIPDLLMRFREKKIAFVSDIRKAFQMIGVDEGERDAMRFLWWMDAKMENIVEFRHARVMFGATCSPFILGAVLAYHLTHLPEEKREIGESLLATLYVDNCVSSVSTIDEYEKFRSEATDLVKSAGMDLRLWFSNVDEFEDENSHVLSVLGLQWDRVNDVLFIAMKEAELPSKITKRSVLSAVQKIYDPVGFTSPALVPMKLLLQRAWNQKLKWDEELPENEKNCFIKWYQEIEDLRAIRLSRLSTVGETNRENWSLHTFTDASKEAYAAVVFLRVKNESSISVQLIAAKSRIAPMKMLTIPKLELMGCLIGKRLADCVKRALKIRDVREFYWCDSTTALAWIRRDPDLWGVFVANRAKEIREGTDVDNWRHVPGVDNPADLPSRGCLPSRLLASKWWLGPAWLYAEESEWPNSNVESDEVEIESERKKSASVAVSVTCLAVLDRMQNTFSFTKQVRILGWVRRFLHNKFVKNAEHRKSGPLNKTELNRAEIILVRQIQRESFPEDERDKLKGLEIYEDDWGVLRVKTRLTYRDDPTSFKFPMILPRKGNAVEQLIREAHKNYCHAGVGLLVTKLRQKYWIVKARHTVRKVISKCPRCRRYSAKPVIPEAAPLPLDRVKNAEVFEVVGIDLAGPLVLKNGRKVWMVIFTCAVYRAVHFEVVSSISTRVFLIALERFVEKFRRPSIIYSDNGTNFRGADNLFKKIDWSTIDKDENTSKITWKFNPVTSSWWGGWWERLIRTAKDLLRRTVGKQSLCLSELKVVLSSVAEVMNGRPLTYVSENPMDLEPLTPALFLHPYGNVSFPESSLSESEQMRYRYNYVTNLKRELRDRFLKEYLSMLVNRNPKKKVTRGLIVGELVLVGCDNIKRIEWPLARVMEVIPGRDGVCRVARVKTERGEITRSVQRLFPLEMDTAPETEKIIRGVEVKTRAGRQVKRPVRYM